MSVMPDMPDMKAYLSYAWYVSILTLIKPEWVKSGW